MDRRDVLKGSAALAAASVLPALSALASQPAAPVVASPPVISSKMTAEAFLERLGPHLRESIEVAHSFVEPQLVRITTSPDQFDNLTVVGLRLNASLLARHPGLYDLDISMSRVIARAGREIVEAKMRKLCSNLKFESQNDLRTPAERKTLDEELFTAFVDEAAEELALEKAMLAREGKVVATYVPLIPGPVLMDPKTFVVALSLYTRYGVVDASRSPVA